MSSGQKPDDRVHWIEWVDAASVGEWIDDADAADIEQPITSVGLLVYEDENKVCLTTSVTQDGQSMDPVAIPQSAITRRYQVVFNVQRPKGKRKTGAQVA